MYLVSGGDYLSLLLFFFFFFWYFLQLYQTWRVGNVRDSLRNQPDVYTRNGGFEIMRVALQPQGGRTEAVLIEKDSCIDRRDSGVHRDRKNERV